MKVRSPLRYPGGKSRAIKYLVPMIEEMGIKEMVSPFFGGGHVEIACATRGIQVHGYDLFLPVVVFWQSLLKEREDLADITGAFRGAVDKDTFLGLQRELRQGVDDPTIAAAFYYVLNRCSFSGTTLSGGYSKQAAEGRFTESSLDRLRNFVCPNMTVRWGDFKDTLNVHPKDMFVYADPPYLIKSQNLYGSQGDLHEGFDHDKLEEILKGRTNWMLSYNNCPEILEKYKDYEILYPDWKYGMGEDKESKELLILSKK
jgi:DNA adenine methylase